MTAIANKDAAYIHELEARLWRSVETAKQASARIEALEAALRDVLQQIHDYDPEGVLGLRFPEARAALAPEQDKPEPDKNYWAGTGRAGNGGDI